MAFFKVSTDADKVREGGDGSGYINTSGLYDIVIKDVIVEETPNGSQYINLWIEHNGKEQPIFQAMRLTNNDGSVNYGQNQLNKLAIIAGFGDGEEIEDPVQRMVPIGKGGEQKECMVLEQFDNMPVTVFIQFEYDRYEGKIQERKMVKKFFRYEDKATASEIVNKEDTPGKQYEFVKEEAEKVVYKADLTKEDIDIWKKERRKGGQQDNTAESKKSVTSFSSRRFGKKQ